MIKELDRNILHICNNFFGTDAYSNVFEEIKNNSINSHILVFMPISAKKDPQYLKKRNCFNETMHIIWENNYIYKTLRFFPFLRFLKVKNLILKLNRAHQFNLVHSHTLFSNGSIGKYISRLLRIPHIVSIRNVDVNEVYKYLFILRKNLLSILKEAKYIVFLNPAYQQKTFKSFKESDLFKDKCIVIPSAIDDFWSNNLGIPKIKNHKQLEILYVGEISPNKNIEFCIKLFLKHWQDDQFRISIVGGTKGKIENINHLKYLQQEYGECMNIEFVGELECKKDLLSYYRKSTIFFMASFKETFGLVYFESMSQGTPLIFTKGQGVDGYFEPGYIGYSVNPRSYEDAKSKVELLLENYEEISSNCIESATRISKVSVISRWIKLYEN